MEIGSILKFYFWYMLKPFFTIILVIFFFGLVTGQKKNTVMYYIKKPWQVVSTKDSADFIAVVFPPDSSVDKYLYIVKGFYPGGKLMSLGGSNNAEPPFKYQGMYTTFFNNGHRKSTSKFENGSQIGDEVQYYPNGQLSSVKTVTYDNKLLLEEFRDSTGMVLTKNGNGKWVYFSDDQNSIPRIEGQVVDGLAQGEWHGKKDDTTNILTTYKDGKEQSIADIYKSGRFVYEICEIKPEFPGGYQKLIKFLDKNVKYPEDARKRKIQGFVLAQFIVEPDGTMSNLKVSKGVGDGCDEEAIRVMRLSPKWKSAMQNGKAVASWHTVAIGFVLNEKGRRIPKTFIDLW